jgi:hypothetical protein
LWVNGVVVPPRRILCLSRVRRGMNPALRTLLVGTTQSASRRSLVVAGAVGVFAATLAAYALELFAVSGGVVFIPSDAATVGVIAGVWIGYARRGLLAAWLVAYAALLGYHADHAFFGLSGRGFGDQFAYFVELEGLVFLAVEAVVLGTLAFIVGGLLRLGVTLFQSHGGSDAGR